MKSNNIYYFAGLLLHNLYLFYMVTYFCHFVSVKGKDTNYKMLIYRVFTFDFPGQRHVRNNNI